MSDRTLAIVFRNPHPKRSPIRTELYLFRRDGTCSRNQCDEAEPAAAKRAMRRTDVNASSVSSLE
jgi:hypothetical protein